MVRVMAGNHLATVYDDQGESHSQMRVINDAIFPMTIEELCKIANMSEAEAFDTFAVTGQNVLLLSRQPDDMVEVTILTAQEAADCMMPDKPN
jgi:hypothetical protein